MSMQEIEIHFKEMEALSEELKAAADKVRKLADQELPEAGAALKEGWQSENADRFLKKEAAAGEAVRKTARNLSDISEELLEKAQKIYQTEQWNCLTARDRTYR